MAPVLHLSSWSMRMRRAGLLLLLLSCSTSSAKGGSTFSKEQYKDALTKSILYFEGQRSGPASPTQRNTWRSDSGLTDGADNGVDLVGGYYDAGDNVKFGVPMAFTCTLMSWGLIEYGLQLDDAGERGYAVEALKWITDYLLKAIVSSKQIWVQVGNPDNDHSCWERPEDMDTSRQSYQVNDGHPGSEPAAETAACLAAASIVFQQDDLDYSTQLLLKAQEAFNFADTYRGSFNDACPYYCSFSGFYDELLWGAAWLYRATSSADYLSYVQNNAGWSYTMNEFLWDNKLSGVAVLLAKFDMEGVPGLSVYRTQADEFICTTLPASSQRRNTITPGGLLFISDDNNMQYVTSASLLFSIHSDNLNNHGQAVTCGSNTFQPSDLYIFFKTQMTLSRVACTNFGHGLDCTQVDYILGDNPLGMSYMVGFGDKYPQQPHHRGASIPSVLQYPAHVGCSEGYNNWYNVGTPNANVHIGAIVGGPNNQDGFSDVRNDWDHLEPMTYINAPVASLLAKILATDL